MDLGWLLKGEFNKTSNRRYIQETALQFCWLEHKKKPKTELTTWKVVQLCCFLLKKFECSH